MMTMFLLYVAVLSLIISKIALHFYLFTSSFSEELKRYTRSEKLAARHVRKIISSGKEPSHIEAEKVRTVFRMKTLLWTFCVGETVGYIFLVLSQHEALYMVLVINAFFLFLASFVCQLMTLTNSWFRKKIDYQHRIGFQLGLLVLGSILIAIAGSRTSLNMKSFLMITVMCFFTSSVIAIYSMLLDAIVFAGRKVYFFDYNVYARLVILLGLLIGTGLFKIFH